MEPPADAGTPSSTPLTTPIDGSTEDLPPFTSDRSQALDKAEILRQVEHYFSDENLQSDAHLLGKLQEGNGSVSVKHILGFPRMRKYKPASAVREILKESELIEVIDNKQIRRRKPFDMAKAKVAAKADHGEEAAKRQAALGINPHLTKGMLKHTGFEHDHVEPALSAEEQQTENEKYSTEHPVYERLETAVLRYKMNRKLHQETLRVFHKFLIYGGFEERASTCTGGMSKEENESLSKEEKARRKQLNFVSTDVVTSLSEQDGKWCVDFEGVTKGFFSTLFPEQFLWHDDLKHGKAVTSAACNVLRNFFNYLLYHRVCAEYTDQINAANGALEAIEGEHVELAAVKQVFPGAFNIACSTFFKGYYANVNYQGDWMTPEEAARAQKGLSEADTLGIISAGVAAFASLEQISSIKSHSDLRVVSTEEDVGLEVVEILSVQHTSNESQEVFSKLNNTAVKPMGKLICKRHHFPKAPPLDLPSDVPPTANAFVFLMDEDTLKKCYLGLKLMVTVKEMNVGLHFIDHWSECHGTFYTWCWNERARDFKEYSNHFELVSPRIGAPTFPFSEETELLEYPTAVHESDDSHDDTKKGRVGISVTLKDHYSSDEGSTDGRDNDDEGDDW